jgi:uncharacterized membrane protein YgdD (TMEM256/DUF423 family)
MHRRFLKIGALLMGVAVVLGAFGAHLLKPYLSVDLLAGYQTATLYQMVHGIGIFIAGILYKHYHNKKILIGGYLFLCGIFFFSGSIYLRVVIGFLGIKSLGLFNLVTPLGGILFMAGWLFMFISIQSNVKRENSKKDEDRLNA